MAAWLIYLKERFPLASHLVLVSGLALTGGYISQGNFILSPFLLSFVGVLLFFALLRLMDEVKDYELDKQAHPERPLPRGLLDLGKVKNVIRGGGALMLIFALYLALTVNLIAAFSYLLLTLYLFLMYKEFGVSHWLAARPITYALSHQLILFFVAYFLVLLNKPEMFRQSEPFFYGLLLIGSFFTYEVCRKLDPDAAPILKTYLLVHGFKGVLVLVLLAMLLAFIGAQGLNLERLLLPVQVSVFIGLLGLHYQPKAFKIVEALASISLLIHIWCIPLSLWFI